MLKKRMEKHVSQEKSFESQTLAEHIGEGIANPVLNRSDLNRKPCFDLVAAEPVESQTRCGIVKAEAKKAWYC
ncbi:hypothetical protein TSUD_185500 [Trifolium subterraneum]|uniref:Uncharacterized protein n=1 Tax=Trifolium subterraneum TaxID=3900 RepID=A0A2Z6PG73_TRISU|nr:hypothetical protein TSUD_185500 [Trifolium subterraneum]